MGVFVGPGISATPIALSTCLDTIPSPLAPDLRSSRQAISDLLVLGGLDGCVVESGQKTSIDFGRRTSLEVIGGAASQLCLLI